MKTPEVWLIIKKFPNYMISNYGRVWSITRLGYGGKLIGGKLVKRWKETGYWRVGLYIKGVQVFVNVHQLVARAFIPNPKRKPQVNHIDGIRSNNYVGNLEWCTAKENAQHAKRIGRLSDKRGERHHMVKLSNTLIHKIRKLYKSGKYSQSHLAMQFGVIQSTISRVVTKKRWSHIKESK